MLADAPGDQLGILGAEVDDENGVASGHVPIVVPGGTQGPARWVMGSVSCHDGDVRSIRRTILLIMSVVALTIGAGGPAVATVPPVATEENEYLDLERSVTECISALPKPGCGREPVDSGDRGGWQQLAVFGVLMAGMAGIGVRVAFAVRSRDRNPIPNPDNSPTL